MPRRNKLRHPVKVVREATELSQKKFAALIGHSKDTIQAIEIGRHNPSQALAEKIFVQTGAVPKTLLKVRGTPLDIEGEPYTRDSFLRWTSTINKPNASVPRRESGAIKYLNWEVATLQHAALRGGKLFAVQYQLDKRITELSKEFRLQPYIDGLLTDSSPTRFAWGQMFSWKPGEPSRLIRRYVERGEKGVSFGQQEIFGFSRAERERQATASARRKLYLTAGQIDGLASRQTALASKINRQSRRGLNRRRQKKRHRRRAPVS
jgi:DNA-binding XRE family transcriptional regulator